MAVSPTPTPPDACALLMEADAAWHALNTGASVRAVTDQNGERLEFSTANRAGLLAYIKQLAPLCTAYQPLALGVSGLSRPVKFLF